MNLQDDDWHELCPEECDVVEGPVDPMRVWARAILRRVMDRVEGPLQLRAPRIRYGKMTGIVATPNIMGHYRHTEALLLRFGVFDWRIAGVAVEE